MSRSVLSCRGCRRTVAVRHHSGRITVEAGVMTVILANGTVELRCGCGAVRRIAADSGRHARDPEAR